MMVPSHALRRVTWRHTIQRHYVCSQSTRLLSYSFQPRSPRKDSQDRESINTEATEYTRSGTDDSVAHTEVAFDDKVTSPEGEKDTTAKRDKNPVDPLEVSPANKDVSKAKTGQGGDSAKSPDK